MDRWIVRLVRLYETQFLPVPHQSDIPLFSQMRAIELERAEALKNYISIRQE